MTKALIPALVAAGLAVTVAEAACQPTQSPPPSLGTPVFLDLPDLRPEQNSWGALGPAAVLAVLRRHPGQTLRLYGSPPGWITATDRDKLRGLASSRVPAAITCPFIAAHAPPAGASSTIGKEARSMVNAAEQDRSWPTGCSDLIRDERRP